MSFLKKQYKLAQTRPIVTNYNHSNEFHNVIVTTKSNILRLFYLLDHCLFIIEYFRIKYSVNVTKKYIYTSFLKI